VPADHAVGEVLTADQAGIHQFAMRPTSRRKWSPGSGQNTYDRRKVCAEDPLTYSGSFDGVGEIACARGRNFRDIRFLRAIFGLAEFVRLETEGMLQARYHTFLQCLGHLIP
jgi:hypothetical protein